MANLNAQFMAKVMLLSPAERAELAEDLIDMAEQVLATLDDVEPVSGIVSVERNGVKSVSAQEIAEQLYHHRREG